MAVKGSWEFFMFWGTGKRVGSPGEGPRPPDVDRDVGGIFAGGVGGRVSRVQTSMVGHAVDGSPTERLRYGIGERRDILR